MTTGLPRRTTAGLPRCNEYDGRQRAGFKRREHQVFIVRTTGGGRYVGPRAGRRSYTGVPKATVQAGKRLVT
jgi:hypothetical protein